MIPRLIIARQASRSTNAAIASTSCSVASKAYSINRVSLTSRSFASTSKLKAPEIVGDAGQVRNNNEGTFKPPKLYNKNESYASSTEEVTPRINVNLVPPAAQSAESASKWLNDNFPELQLPDKVLMQMITHESFDRGMSGGHNRRLSFMGRRIMKFSLNLFLFKNSNTAHLQSEKIIDRLLQTSNIGDHVATKLKLPQIMRWTPAVNRGQSGGKETGLFKISGRCLEALVGATFHQHGGQAARALFCAKILPLMRTLHPTDAQRLSEQIQQERKWGEEYLEQMIQSRQALSISPSNELILPFRTGHDLSLDSIDQRQPSRAVMHKQLGRIAKSRTRSERRRKAEGKLNAEDETKEKLDIN